MLDTATLEKRLITLEQVVFIYNINLKVSLAPTIGSKTS